MIPVMVMLRPGKWSERVKLAVMAVAIGVMVYGVTNPYERLKALTRGVSGMTREDWQAFVDGLAIPDEARARLKALSPATYVGNAEELARRV